MWLTTALPPDEVARRINGMIASPLQPFATGILGRASAGHLALRYRAGLFAYKGMPMLTGPITARGSGSLLALRYRGRATTLAAFPIGYAVIAAMVVAWAIWGQCAPGISPQQKALLIAILIIFPNLPLLIHVVGIRNGEAHLAKLAAFLKSTLNAVDAEEGVA